MDLMLWGGRHRPNRISMYATGLAAQRPDWSAAPWQRTLGRHFGHSDRGPMFRPTLRRHSG